MHLPTGSCFLLLFSSWIIFLSRVIECSSDLFVNGFAIKVVDDSKATAEAVARHHGFIVKSELEKLHVFYLVHLAALSRHERGASRPTWQLITDSRVKYAAQQKLLIREKREIIHGKQAKLQMQSIEDPQFVPKLDQKGIIPGVFKDLGFNDPFYQDQWYLHNTGQTGGTPGVDLNLVEVWRKNITGQGVVICILDDGIDHTHPDLRKNYDAKASTDLNDEADILKDPMPDMEKAGNSHGTRCAGEVAAAANNSNCGVGVAYEARIGGVRMLDGNVTDYLESVALTFNYNYIDIFSASWGPRDDGRIMEMPGPLAKAALQKGVTEGRNGLGAIYVWATGNGGLMDDDCNADGYVSSIETLSVGSVTDEGHRPYFMEVCSSTLAVVPTGGAETRPTSDTKPKAKVVTTDLRGKCTKNFEGTSSAAPLAAGCLALVLEANPGLSWRDVQHLVVHTARIPAKDKTWLVNGAGLHVSPVFGFGIMDCGQMVEEAQKWTNVPEQHLCELPVQFVEKFFKYGKPLREDVEVDTSKINRLEHVQVYIKLEHGCRGDVQIFLISPSGTKSELLSPRKLDNLHDGIDFEFLTVLCWDEDPSGNWTIEIHDAVKNDVNDGKLVMWKLKLYGSLAQSRGNEPEQTTLLPVSNDLAQKLHEKQYLRGVNVERDEEFLDYQHQMANSQEEVKLVLLLDQLERILDNASKKDDVLIHKHEKTDGSYFQNKQNRKKTSVQKEQSEKGSFHSYEIKRNKILDQLKKIMDYLTKIDNVATQAPISVSSIAVKIQNIISLVQKKFNFGNFPSTRREEKLDQIKQTKGILNSEEDRTIHTAAKVDEFIKEIQRFKNMNVENKTILNKNDAFLPKKLGEEITQIMTELKTMIEPNEAFIMNKEHEVFSELNNSIGRKKSKYSMGLIRAALLLSFMEKSARDN